MILKRKYILPLMLALCFFMGLSMGFIRGSNIAQVESSEIVEELVLVSEFPMAARPIVTHKRGFYHYYSPTLEEMHNMARMVLAESRGESRQGQLEVAYVILNRVRSSLHPNTINGVLFEKGQFSPVADGSFKAVNTTFEALQIVREAFRTFDTSYQATYFMNPRTSSANARRWQENNTNKLYTIGNHVFSADKNPIWRF